MTTTEEIEINKIQERTPNAPYYVKGLALGLCAYLIGVHFWTWVFSASVFIGGHADFRQLYTAGYMVRTGAGSQLYDYDAQLRFQNLLVTHEDLALPFIRPAYAALLFAPLSRLSFKVAYLIFLGVNVSLLALCWLLLRSRSKQLSHVYRWLPAGLFLAYIPIAAALLQGQDSILLLTLFVMATIALDRGQEMTAGLLVGAGLFKLQIVLPIAVLFLLWRRWRFSLGFCISATIAGFSSVLVVGQHVAWDYARSLFMANNSSQLPNVLHSYPLNSQLMPNLHGLVEGFMAGHMPWAFALTVLLSGAAFLFAAVRGSELKGGESLYLAITTSVLVSYYLLIHDLSVLFLPILVFLDRFVDSEASGDRLGRMIVRTSLLAFVAPVCMAYTASYFYLVCLPILALLLAQTAVSSQFLTSDRSNMVLTAAPAQATSHALTSE